VLSAPPLNLVTAACGLLPVLTAMTAAREMGATAATVVSYANSADAAVGDPSRVVGYGAVIFSKGGRNQPAKPSTADDVRASDEPTVAERRALLGLARLSIARYLLTGMLPLPRDFGAQLAGRRQGAFVTLERRGQLRGCVGRLTTEVPLPQLVSRVAVEAAIRDPRFPPVKPGELPGLDVQISLVSSPRAVDAPHDIVVGRDGVVLEKDGRSAVFLPQVVSDAGWTRDEMLEQLCAKARLPAGCWVSGARLATFQAQVFSDRGAR
jgi:AmmeMemoRadiSam system protein A